MIICDVALLGAAGVLAVPVGVIALETGAALWARRQRLPGAVPPPDVAAPQELPPVAVIIPAHNEQSAIGRTLAVIQEQLRPLDRLVVVADNCTDQTGAVARESGAEVVTRQDETHRGKGYALAAGVEHLRQVASPGGEGAVPPQVVVVVDADTLIEAGTIRALAHAVIESQSPAQGICIMEMPTEPGLRTGLSAFAFLYKNWVRALGADVLGVPCCLRGTGMAFPWRAIAAAPLATGNLVEDMQLGVDLAIVGFVPRLCRGAFIRGILPEKMAANLVQRTRWEQGHLRTIVHNVPRLFWEGLRQRRPVLWLLALDLAPPPLALLALTWCVLTALAGGMALLGWASAAPLVVALASGGAMGASILAAWAKFARQIVPWTTLLAVPFYVLWKIPVYVGFLFKRQKVWVRTQRT